MTPRVRCLVLAELLPCDQAAEHIARVYQLAPDDAREVAITAAALADRPAVARLPPDDARAVATWILIYKDRAGEPAERVRRVLAGARSPRLEDEDGAIGLVARSVRPRRLAGEA